MVTSITSFGRSGLYDWMMQRVTAVVLMAYTIFMIGYLLFNPSLDYAQWSGLFSGTAMRIFTLLAILSMAAHAWIGLWSVSTDYIKITSLRFVFQSVCGLLAFIYVVWGIQILWGA
ncbi:MULTISPECIES: succinate dehydrogenase, hydrophobic membrane anchor protein [Nitrincola]|uniref:Succinate dehydrogenase hydrophobic membrane anchor subunit n=2 Tax=Nitrincola TaxID=267849 RepID=A0A364NKR2_9GAMM|nr:MULTISPECIES: succinate dehydrogenase, hydrophobic membrane anchor protein [Nitrincola]EXJ13110.1 Succinate dehydrogenase hydrophobic membrane anchor subunit [Nitrincola nitratireducens]RAU17673.1 succinate dehydrogenase, hydrophobic membrane anchor protein [Nitrincola tibetensis]